jgi:hypothetical protein
MNAHVTEIECGHTASSCQEIGPELTEIGGAGGNQADTSDNDTLV